MPTIFSHAIFASVVGKAFVKKSVFFWFWLLTALCAIIPDADVAGLAFGIKFGSLFGHRGFTHSIMFALIFGGVIAFFADRFLQTGISFIKLFVYFSLATFSHPLLDMLTNGGSGVALLAPFSNERYFFPWRPVEVSPIGMGFFSDRGLDVILSEIIWIWLPAFAVLILATIIRKLRNKN
jgi:inner membrane protein